MTLRRFAYCYAVACLLALASLGPGTLIHAADPGTGDPAVENGTGPTESDAPEGVWGILKAGGPVGVVIMLLSVAAVALVIEHIVTIREPVLMPPGLADQVRQLLADGQLTPARQRCRAEPSFLAFVLEAGLAEAEGGWPAIEKATEDAAADQSARLFRKIEYLSVIGSIAPMLGLLGTVIGMILAFRKVAGAEGVIPPAELPRELAGGIYLALVTTVEGLIVAIPSLAAFAVFRNRVDQLVAEVAYVTQHVVAPLKRGGTAGKPKGTSPPAPPPVGGR
ncbi:MAG: MotA/TolQ/ExbB proton channel family protein [Planctomycetota bacterium]|jgi:biopolymer transport protein ExbB